MRSSAVERRLAKAEAAGSIPAARFGVWVRLLLRLPGWPNGKASDCNSDVRRFDSDPGLTDGEPIEGSAPVANREGPCGLWIVPTAFRLHGR